MKTEQDVYQKPSITPQKISTTSTPSFHKLKCSCGHVGAITGELCTPRDLGLYKLEKLKGGCVLLTRGLVDLKEIFPMIRPKCPKCENLLTENDIFT